MKFILPAVLLFSASLCLSQNTMPAGEDFERVRRESGVKVADTYNIRDLRIPLEDIHELRPKDHFKALVNPELTDIESADWVGADFRVIEVVIGNTQVAIPLRLMNYHELANMVIEGKAIAVTYCPLCDSASVFSREMSRTVDGRIVTETLEFGVTGALYNSNVLLYDRTHLGIWSQLGMEAVSGPYSGTPLEHLWINIVKFGEFTKKYPEGRVISKETGYDYDYTKKQYANYFAQDRLAFPVRDFGQKLPKKTLGIGVLAEDKSWFVTVKAIGDRYKIETAMGPVILSSSSAGVKVESAPKGVQTAQTFYYSWSAFHPDTKVVSEGR